MLNLDLKLTLISINWVWMLKSLFFNSVNILTDLISLVFLKKKIISVFSPPTYMHNKNLVHNHNFIQIHTSEKTSSQIP
jgi:hypothetical protein